MKGFQMGLLVLISIPLYGTGQTKQMALADLQSLLYAEKEWIKVHVAEFLLWEGYYADEVRAEFSKEEQQSGHLPKYRIGIWRVLAQAAADNKDRQCWIDKIISVYRDTTAEDRLHAIETLAKLKVPVIRHLPENLEGSFRLYSLWNQALGSESEQRKVKDILIQDLVNNKLTEIEIQVTSYILRYIGPLSRKEYNQIVTWMKEIDLKTASRSNLLATLLISYPKNQPIHIKKALKQELISLQNEKEALPHIMMALAQKGDVSDKETILSLYEHACDKNSTEYNSDLHATAAYMLLKSF